VYYAHNMSDIECVLCCERAAVDSSLGPVNHCQGRMDKLLLYSAVCVAYVLLTGCAARWRFFGVDVLT